jgi:hypothetical protein
MLKTPKRLSGPQQSFQALVGRPLASGYFGAGTFASGPTQTVVLAVRG